MPIARVKASVRPINPSADDVINDVALHATVEAGQLVYHDGTGWALSVLTNATTGAAVGVCLKDGASGDKVDVLVHGRVTGWTGLTAGGQVYSAAAGEIVHTTNAQFSGRVGFAINTTDWYFVGQPTTTIP